MAVQVRPKVQIFSVLGVSALGILVGAHNDRLTLALLPHWLPLFAIGMLTFQFVVGHLRLAQFLPLLGVLSATCWTVLGTNQTIAGLVTAAAVLGFRLRPLPGIFRPLAFAGTISYSIYLMHSPVGGRIINLASRLPPSLGYRYSAILLAFGISLVFAVLFWQLVERPSHRWAKSNRRS